jgi:beta-glucosidase
LQTTAQPGPQPPLFPRGYGLTYADDGGLVQLSEEVPAQSGSTSLRTYFAGGKTGAGWTLAVSEGEGAHTVLNAAIGASATGALRVSAVDRATQEDARLVSWSGGRAATLALESAKPVDLQREANGQLSLAFNYRVDAPPAGDVELAMECGDKCRGTLALGPALRDAPPGEWRQFKVLLQCFQKSGADMRSISAPFTLTTAGPLQLRIANVRLDTGLSDAVSCD